MKMWKNAALVALEASVFMVFVCGASACFVSGDSHEADAAHARRMPPSGAPDAMPNTTPQSPEMPQSPETPQSADDPETNSPLFIAPERDPSIEVVSGPPHVCQPSYRTSLDGTLVHVIKVYEAVEGDDWTESPDGEPIPPRETAGRASIRLTTPGKHVLWLRSYERVAWTIEAAEGAELLRVHLEPGLGSWVEGDYAALTYEAPELEAAYFNASFGKWHPDEMLCTLEA